MMADSPKTILQKLVEIAMQACRADSAGISILEPGGSAGMFQFHAIAGQFASKIGAPIPREASPSGIVLDFNAPLLFAYPERHFKYGIAIDPPTVEALMVPFHLGGKPVGTLWVIAHTLSRQFDSEDERVLKSLSCFASAGYQMKTALFTSDAELRTKFDAVRQILDTSATGLTCCSRDLRYLSANPAYARLAGLSVDQIIGRPIVDVIGAEGFEVIRPWVDRVLRGDRVEYEEEVPFAAGGPRFLHVAYTPWIDAQGHVAGWVASVSDITRPKQRVEGALRASEERLRLATRSAGIGVFDYDAGAERTLWSPELCALVGVPVGTIRSINDVLGLVHPDDRARFINGVAATNDLRGDGKFSDEFRICRPDTGEVRWMAKFCQTFFEGNGNSRRAIRTTGVMMDITERMVRERQDRFLNDLSVTWIRARDVPALVQITADAIARHLEVNLVTFADITPDASLAIVGLAHGYAKPATQGTYVVGDYLTKPAQADLFAGRTLVVNDVTTDPRTGFAGDRYVASGTRAMIVVPLRNDRGVRSVLHVNTIAPRAWQPDEVRLLERVAARLWLTVERARAEDALRQSEERLQFLLKLSDALRPLNDPIAMEEIAARLLGEHLKVNRVIYSDIEGTDFIVKLAYENGVAPVVRSGQIASFGKAVLEEYRRGDTVHVNDVHTDPRFTESERANLLASEIVSFVRAMLMKDGQWVAAFSVHSAVPRVWTEAEVALFRDVAERIWEAVERAQARVAWRSTEARFRAFLENSHTIAWLKDEEGGHVFLSPTYERRFGVRTEDWHGKTDFDLWPKDVAEQFWQNDRAVLAASEPMQVLESAPNPDGTISWWLNNKFSFRDASGRRYIGGIGLDVTDRKLAEEALLEANRRKNKFIAMLSHELRNPLAVIRNSLYILDHAAEASVQTRQAQSMIDRQVAHMTRLTDDLLDVARITSGKVQLQREVLDLDELVERTVEDHRKVFLRNGVNLEILTVSPEVCVNGDRTRLAQIIGNLLQNAVKFTPRGGKASVSVEANSARGQAIIRVQDTGAGIAQEFLPQLFEAFSQADATLSRTKGGLGLGLAVVKGLVEMHGGSVRVESDGILKGSIFTIALPLEAAPAPKTSGLHDDAVETPRRLLIIEDNMDVADSLCEVLRFRGHHVEVAYTGRDGLEKARAFAPEVVLCDVGLPEMDGYRGACAPTQCSVASRLLP
jgi:PAS domain S-box-containing protein